MIQPSLFPASVQVAMSTKSDADKLLRTHTPSKPAVYLQQVHGSQIGMIDKIAGNVCLKGADAVITSQPNTRLLLRVADCLPIILFHTSGVLCAIHAGRRGTQANITAKCAQQASGIISSKSNWQAWLGPCICPSCYQVNRETDEHFDLVKENVEQLQAVLTAVEIETSGYCTCHKPELFHSYRREGPGVPMNWVGANFGFS